MIAFVIAAAFFATANAGALHSAPILAAHHTPILSHAAVAHHAPLLTHHAAPVIARSAHIAHAAPVAKIAANPVLAAPALSYGHSTIAHSSIAHAAPILGHYAAHVGHVGALAAPIYGAAYGAHAW